MNRLGTRLITAIASLNLAHIADFYGRCMRFRSLSKISCCMQSKKTKDFCHERQFFKSNMFDIFSRR